VKPKIYNNSFPVEIVLQAWWKGRRYMYENRL